MAIREACPGSTYLSRFDLVFRDLDYQVISNFRVVIVADTKSRDMSTV